jgi:acetyltransferase-like isoleucine patch superfamily enzyme
MQIKQLLLKYIPFKFDPIATARKQGAIIGNNCRLINVSFGSEPWLVKLGDHVSATSTSFITHDGGVWVFRQEFPDLDILSPIEVGDNVFIGSHAIILPGTKIGNNTVIGAGSIVRGTFPANIVIAGTPARFIKSLAAYRNKCLSEGRPTKSLSAQEKRAYYRYLRQN